MKKRIILVEDEKLLREELFEVLVKEGFEVIACDGFESARKEWKQQKVQIDFVVTDYDFGEGSLNGGDIVEMVRDEPSSIPIIVYTGGNANLISQVFKYFEGVQVLSKREGMDPLLLSIKTQLRRP